MLRAKGATTLQPRASPWDSVATISSSPCRGEIRRTPHVPIEHPREANGGPAMIAAVSIPHMSLVIRDVVALQELPELLLQDRSHLESRMESMQRRPCVGHSRYFVSVPPGIFFIIP